MRPYISKTIYMSIAHYSPVLNVIAAQLGTNSWNNKIHWVAVTESSSYFMLPPALQKWKEKKGKVRWKKVEERMEWGREAEDKSESHILFFNVLLEHSVQKYAGLLKGITTSMHLKLLYEYIPVQFSMTNYFQAIKNIYNCFLCLKLSSISKFLSS